MYFSRKLLSTVLLFLIGVAAIISGFFLLTDFSFVHEDAWLTHRYTKHLTLGYGLVSHPGLLHDEGFSSLSWVSAIAFIAKVLGIDVIITGKILAYFSFVGTFYFTLATYFLFIQQRQQVKPVANAFLLKSFGCLFLIVGIGWSQGYLYWVNALLETPWYCFWNAVLLYVAARILLLDNIKLFCLLGFLCTLSWASRPEGVINGIGLFFFFGAYFYFSRVGREKWKLYWLGFFLFLLSGVMLFARRLWYFEDYISSAAYVKLGLRYWARNTSGYLLSFIFSKGMFFTSVLSSAGLYVLLKNLFLLKKNFTRMQSKEFLLSLFALLLIGLVSSQVFVVWYTGGEPLGYSRFLLPQYHVFLLLPLIAVVDVFGNFGVSNNKIIGGGIALVLLVSVAQASLFDRGRDVLKDKFSQGVDLSGKLVHPREKAAETTNYREAQKILSFLKKNPGVKFAHTEYGIIPWFINQEGPYTGVDILGLNTRQVARNFKYYPFEEVFYAFRDYVLSQTPGILGCHSIFKESSSDVPVGWTTFDTEEGKVRVGPAISWALNPYFESEFFLQHYSFDVKTEASGEWPMFYNKNNFHPSSVVSESTFDKSKDKLFHGFVKRDGKLWASSFSRIFLRKKIGDKEFCIKGKSAVSYGANELYLSVRINRDAVGDHEIGSFKVQPNAYFTFCSPLSSSPGETDADVLLTIVANPMEPLITVPRKLGEHKLSFIVNELGIYSKPISHITEK